MVRTMGDYGNHNNDTEDQAVKLTAHEKEQQIYSDTLFDPNSRKDFKQEALKRHQDMINDVDQKEADEKFQNFASTVEHGSRLLEEQREKFMHKLYGYEVSETDVRKAATNILRDYDAFAARFNLEGNDKSAVYDQILLLQQGTVEEQEQALKDLHERDPKLAEAVLEEAKREQDLAARISSSNDHNYSHDYNVAAAEPTLNLNSALKPATI